MHASRADLHADAASTAWAAPRLLARTIAAARQRPVLDAIGGWRALEAALGLAPNGVSRGIASPSIPARQAHFGRNVVAAPRAKSLPRLMFEAAFLDRTNLMLLGAGLVSLLLGVSVGDHPSTDWVEGTCVLVAVAAIVLVTALTEFKKERQFQALNAVKNNPLVHVVRDDGTPTETSKWGLVVGDLVVLHTGDVVPADGVLLSSHELRVDESAMTGEAEPVGKHWESEKCNVVLGGTTVMEGGGSMVVLCVGEHTQEGMVLNIVNGEKSNKKTDEKTHKSVQTDGYVGLATPRAAAADADSDDQDVELKAEADALDRTPLALKLERLNLTMGKIGAVVSTLLFFALSVKFSIKQFAIDDEPWTSQALSQFVNFFILAVTTLVVAIPEGLPLAVIIALTYSVRQMLRDKSLVRHLYACETAGNATIICSDKTGTLTTNEMTVTAVWLGGERHEIYSPQNIVQSVVDEATVDLLMQSMAVNSSAELLAGNDRAATGSPTESALLRFVRDAGFQYDALRSGCELVRVVPFNSDRKCMTTVVRVAQGGKTLVLTKGAPEAVLQQCASRRQYDADGKAIVSLLSGQQRDMIMSSVIGRHAMRGCRTLCLAYKELSSDDSTQADSVETELTLLAVVAIEDPIRLEVPRAIEMCKSAGVAVCIVTGDNILTASAIARQCGILDADPSTEDRDLEEGEPAVRTMDASEFRARVADDNGGINQVEFDRIWPTLRVLARATPLDKYVLVSGLMASQVDPQLVAVTGDGTNDAAALKKAHVGFAMGQGGTEVAKRASDIVVLDDNFLSIVNAIKWGRNVYDSIAKFLQFQLTMIAVAVTMAVGSALFMDSPALTAVQILWVNLFMDAFVSLGLATEEPTDRVMQRRPYKLDSPLLSRKMRKHIAGQCAFQLLVLVLRAGADWPMASPQVVSSSSTDATVQSTMAFNTFAWMQLFNQINCRRIDDERNVFAGLVRNRLFVCGWLLQAALQWAAVQFGSTLFQCVTLSVDQWLVCVGVAALTLPWGLLLRLVG